MKPPADDNIFLHLNRPAVTLYFSAPPHDSFYSTNGQIDPEIATWLRLLFTELCKIPTHALDENQPENHVYVRAPLPDNIGKQQRYESVYGEDGTPFEFFKDGQRDWDEIKRKNQTDPWVCTIGVLVRRGQGNGVHFYFSDFQNLAELELKMFDLLRPFIVI